MAQTKTNLISTVKTGEFPVKAAKLIGRGPKIPEAEKLFSEKLKEMSFETIGVADEIPDPNRGELHPVRPKLEKQGGVRKPSVSDGSGSGEKAADVPPQLVIKRTDMNADGGSAADNAQKGISENGSGELPVVENIPAVGGKIFSDVKGKPQLVEISGIFAPQIGSLGDMAAEKDGETDSDTEGTALFPAVDTEYEDKKGVVLFPQTEKEADGGTKIVSRTEKARENLGNNADNNKANTENKTEDAIGEKGAVNRIPYQGKLYKGTLEDLIKSGGLSFGDIITFAVTDKGIFIGGEDGSREDLSNFADGDLFGGLFDVLSRMLESQSEPDAGQQLKQLIAEAIRKVVSDMHDPVKQEEEYQKKLLDFLMKFVDSINGKNRRKETALGDDEDRESEGLLLKLIENLIEASEKNSEEDKKEYTAAIYIYGAEIGLLNAEGISPDKLAEEDGSEEADSLPEAEIGEDLSDISQGQMPEPKRAYAQSYGAAKAKSQEVYENAEAVGYESLEKTDLNAAYNAFLREDAENGSVKSTAAAADNGADADNSQNAAKGYVDGYNALYGSAEYTPVSRNGADLRNNSVYSGVKETDLTAAEEISVTAAAKTENAAKENIFETKTENTPEENNLKANALKTNTRNTSEENIFEAKTENPPYGVQRSLQAHSGKGEAEKRENKGGINSAGLTGRRIDRSTTSELEELKRLFGVKNPNDKKLKEMNELKSEEEASEEGGSTEKTVVPKEDSGVLDLDTKENKGISDKSIIQSVTVEALKADSEAVAKAYTPDERGAKQIMTQIISEMLNNLSRSSGAGKTVTTLTMTLTPESLGKITMKVTEEAGKISLMVTAHSKETAEILSQRTDAMQQAAKDSGTQLEKYQVVYAPQEDGRTGHQSFDGSSKNPYVRQDTEEQPKDGGEDRFADLLKQAI